MTYEEFRNLAQGIQAVLFGVALIIGAGWAIYRFRSLLSVQKAKVDLSKTNAELEKSRADLRKLQLDLQDRPYLTMQLASFVVGSENSEGLFIRLCLVISNSGTQPDSVSWVESTIRCSLVEGWSSGQPSLGPPVDGVIGMIDRDFDVEHLWPGESSTDEFLIPIDCHGLYLIEVLIPASPSTEIMILDQLDTFGKKRETAVFSRATFFDTRVKTTVAIVDKKNVNDAEPSDEP